MGDVLPLFPPLEPFFTKRLASKVSISGIDSFEASELQSVL
jgi:hypothetical protein